MPPPRRRAGPILRLLPSVAAISNAADTAIGQFMDEYYHSRPWTAHFLDDYPLAVCNDGSPAAYYYRAGIGWSSRQWLVFLEGGGWCWDDASCKGYPSDHNSSSNFPTKPEEIRAWAQRLGSGILSTEHGPLKDARVAYVRMCSNDAFMGDASPPHSYWHFRGKRIIDAVFTDLQRRTGLGSQTGDLVVYGGCSAGARGVLVSIDYVQSTLIGKAEVVGLMDSGFWVPIEPLDPPPKGLSLEMQTRQVLAAADVPREFIGETCASHYPRDALWKCLFGAFRLPFLRVRYLLVHSQYDNFAISTSLYGYYSNDASRLQSHSKDLNFAEQYRRQVVKYLPPLSEHSGNAIFSTACYTHCTITHPEVEVYHAAGVSFPKLLDHWLSAASAAKATVTLMDHCQGFDCGRPESRGRRRLLV